MKLFLIRHGETQHNLRKIYIGHTDSPLNRKGKKQARSAGLYLSKTRIRAVYSSDLKRAHEFATIAFKGVPVNTTAALREIDFGIFEGLSHEQIMKKHPQLYQKWLRDPWNTQLPQGESIKTLETRVKKILKKIYAQNKTGIVAVVSHAGPIKIILQGLMRDAKFWDIPVNNGSLSVIEYKKGATKLKIHNDTSFHDRGRK